MAHCVGDDIREPNLTKNTGTNESLGAHHAPSGGRWSLLQLQRLLKRLRAAYQKRQADQLGHYGGGDEQAGKLTQEEIQDILDGAPLPQKILLLKLEKHWILQEIPNPGVTAWKITHGPPKHCKYGIRLNKLRSCVLYEPRWRGRCLCLRPHVIR